jgi:hypothetical protein
MIAMQHNQIPPMTDPMGLHWRQPDPALILTDDTHALMSQTTFDKLSEYSCTTPSGCYPGKMWKRHDGLYDPKCKPEDRCWYLAWYGVSEKGPDWCSNNYRQVIIM